MRASSQNENIIGNDTGLRFRLRRETETAHKRLDDALIKHDLTTLSGLRSYLSVHFLARDYLQNIMTGYEALRDDKEKLSNLRADFDVLDMPLPQWKDMPDRESHHPLGLIYVIAGSALGSKLLYKHWSAASDPDVLEVKNFMTCAKDSRIWADFLVHLNANQFTPAETHDMILGAEYCFGVFEAANNQIVGSL